MTITRRTNNVLAEQVVLAVESSVQALGSGTGPVATTGSVTADTNANMADGDTVTIIDGFRKVTYEYDKSANGVAAGNVSWTAGTTAATVATNLATAIAANQPAISVADNAAGVLTLTNRWPGTGGNNTVTKSSASALAVTGMTGGVDDTAGSTSVAATATQKFHKCERVLKVDSVTANMPVTGVVQSATDYWTIELKDGATSMAKWSTQTSQQGTITANTPFTLVNSATAANLVAAAADTLSLVLTKTGTPAALPPVRMTVNAHFVS